MRKAAPYERLQLERSASGRAGRRMRKSLLLVAAVALLLPLAAFSGSSPRSGMLHVTKECSQYTGAAGSFCTITSSNVKAIPVGSKVIYKDAPGASGIDTDIVLDTGPGNSAYGHVVLDLTTGYGTVTLDGGTGKFTHFHAFHVDVTPLGFPNWAWDGPYSFSPHSFSPRLD